MRLKRKILFYAAEVQPKDDSTYTDDQKKQILSVLAGTLRRKGMPITAPFTPHPESTNVIGRIIGNSSPHFGEIAYARKTALPAIWNKSTQLIRPIKLKEDEDLYEPTHFLLTEAGILALEYNHHGPRSGTLERYLNWVLSAKQATNDSIIRILPIIRHPGLDPLGNFQVIKKIRIKVATNWAKLIAMRDASLADLFKAAQLVDGDYLTITIDVGRKRNGSLGDRVKGIISTVFNTANGDYENLKNLELKGTTIDNTTDVIDLVEEHVTSQEDVVTVDDETKLIDKDSMRKGLQNAYDKRRQELSQYERRD